MGTNDTINKINHISRCALACFQDKLPQYGARQKFPRNCCEEVSIILNGFLKENKICDFKLIRGTDLEGAHHFWLEDNEVVIDLTAHQFENINQPFILVPKCEYPLRIIFSEDIHEFISSAPWPYLNELQPKIRKVFYANYFLI